MTKKENHLKLIPQNNGVCYNEKHNYLITRINQSCAGNIYLSCLRLSKKLSIVFKLGIGNSKVFINSITVSSYPEGRRFIIGCQTYYGFEYNEAEIILCTKQILNNGIVEILNKNKTIYEKTCLRNHINELINETMHNQLEFYNNTTSLFSDKN